MERVRERKRLKHNTEGVDVEAGGVAGGERWKTSRVEALEAGGEKEKRTSLIEGRRRG